MMAPDHRKIPNKMIPSWRKGMLAEVAGLLEKLTYGETLTAEETRRAFNVIGNEDTESYFYLALTFGLMTRGPTLDELYGVCLDRADRVSLIEIPGIDSDSIIDLSGGGGGAIKTINVSTLASLIVASAGVYVAKQAASAVTSSTGSRDLLETLGIQVPLTDGDPKIVQDCLRRFRLAPYNYAAFSPGRFDNFLRWRNKIREISLTYLTPWHLVSFVYSPIAMTSRVYGLFSERYIMTIAELLQRFGYHRALVVHGRDGLDEISNVGPTAVCEIKDGNISEYTITPSDLGVLEAKPTSIESISREDNILDFLRIIYRKDRGPKRDLVTVNAGAGLYVAGKASSLREGTKLAESLLESGAAAEKLEQLIDFSHGGAKLDAWRSVADV